MEYTMEQRGKLIINECLETDSRCPIDIFVTIAKKDFIRMHGPEHHILDGAALLTAFYNAGGKIELKEALDELMKRALSMPGAMCGLWGVCGAVTALGAALSIIDGTSPLSADGSWGRHMDYTSSALLKIAKTNGPRCCKRDGFLSLKEAVKYVNENYGVVLEDREITCSFFERNEQCIGDKCPFKKKRMKKVAFICVHNSCRSQIAEALGRLLASDVFESYSAGTETKPSINQDAVRLMKEIYGIDMEQIQYSKLMNDIPCGDILISMGCNVSCPVTERGFDDNWELEDPTGKSDDEFIKVIKEIEKRIILLKDKLCEDK